MGNNQGNSRGADHHGGRKASAVPDEPLEAYLREKQRNDHLKNLGLKRHTSLRKSISKKLKRHKPPKPPPSNNETNASEVEVVDHGASSSNKSHCDVHEEQPFRRPSYNSGSQPNLSTQASEHKKKRSMENLRKSFRASLRRKKDKDPAHSTGDFVKDRTGGSSKSKLWQQDEIAVRAGTCNFDVKYLGCIEVFESRGMTVCEEALKKLKSSKKKSVRAILYVNGDGLRVVDYETKGLLLDQTIEKVSFCAPDHNYERGFSYICRDGTTRRWMCHGFMAVKETGDRLSHAVGCAFAICLEKKQKRDQECAVSMNFDNKNSSFTRIGSFRQATITERLADPQGIKPSEPPPPKATAATAEEANPFAIARPHATDIMLQRQTSFREFTKLQSRTSPFKRQLSLRMSELPSSLERKNNDAMEFSSPTSAASDSNHSMVQNSVDPFGELCEQFKNQAFFSPSNSINSSLFTKAELSTVPEDEDTTAAESTSSQLPPPLMASPIKPTKPSPTVEPILEESREEEDEEESNDENFPLSNSTIKATLPFDSENPWDLVPDQPAKNKLDIIGKNDNDWPSNNDVNTIINAKQQDGQNLMDDPFDADWVSLALNQTNNTHF